MSNYKIESSIEEVKVINTDTKGFFTITLTEPPVSKTHRGKKLPLEDIAFTKFCKKCDKFAENKQDLLDKVADDIIDYLDDGESPRYVYELKNEFMFILHYVYDDKPIGESV